MKIYFFTFILLFCAFEYTAQITDYNRDTHESLKFTDEQMEKLRSSKTLFVLRDQDTLKRKDFEAAFKRVWKLTELKFITYKEMDQYKNSGHSFFHIGGHVVTITTDKTTSTRPFLYLLLIKDNIIYARMELFMDVINMGHVEKEGINKGLKKIYTGKGRIKNWNPAQLSIYLGAVQNELLNSIRRGYYEEIMMSYSFLENTKNVIYAMDYLDEKFQPFSGDESKRHDLNKIFKHCPFEIKFVSPTELLQKMQNNEVRYFFDYVKDCIVMNFKIYDLQENKIIYSTNKSGRYNIKASDIKEMFD
jgi:hypothetical protein